ncbi:MAG TPA: glycerate kinase [Chthoniobacterales bacterium]|nr:glycerate kinase [Chthoniobacterales bacterium]
MRILIAPDKFKGSLGACEVANAIAAGIRDILQNAEITCMPVADGGEGTAEVICAAAGGEWHECEVHDPLGALVTARYCTIEHGATAVMEMSEASGLWRVPESERDPLLGSSFGTGEMLRDAARRGVREIILGLGGSATNDGGVGCARALGFHFLDVENAQLGPAVPELLRLAQIVRPDDLRLPRIIAAVDVRNPLLGKRGATRTFGPQKGATHEQVELLERALQRLADVVARDFGTDHREIPGAGAAGGLGYALASFCSAELRPGFEVVSERIGLLEAIEAADIVITGEGRLDAQTAEGKAPAGVAKLVEPRGKKVFAIVGAKENDQSSTALFDGVLSLVDEGITAEAAMQECAELLQVRARHLAQQFSAGG